MTGSEDGSDSVAAYLRAGRRVLGTVPGAALIIVHHAGWQDGDNPRKRERGSSVWRGNTDASIYLEAGDYDRDRGTCPVTLRTLKSRDGDKPLPLHVIRRRVELSEMDRYGQPVTSCIIESDPRTHADREAEARDAADTEARALDVRVLQAIRDQHPTSVDALRTCLGLRRPLVSDALARVLSAGWAQIPDRQRQPYGITTAGIAALNGGHQL
jgi:hypothetical protein